MIRREDYLVPKAGGKFNAEEYDAYPEKYRSIFAEKASIVWIDKNRFLFDNYSANILFQRRSQPENLVPLCKFQSIITYYFFRN